MGSETFHYVLQDGAVITDTIDVTVTTPATNSTGFGLGYVVTGITGSVNGTPITGESGIGGIEQTDSTGFTFDNTVFASDASGVNSSGGYGSSNGIDFDGLEFTAGGVTYNLYVAGSDFSLRNLTTSTVDLVTLTSSDAPCYCPGTLILTDRGNVPVEALAIGDAVVTASGQHRPIGWIGRRAYDGRFLRANPAVQPILFRAGSLGDGLPHRDLRVSPKHAMFLDGMLVPAEHLVNGSTIIRDRGCKKVDYFHIELDRHDVLLAEGAPSESYVEDDNRGIFHNAAEWQAMYPGRKRLPAVYCAPRAETGFELEAIRRRLAEVAREVAQAA